MTFLAKALEAFGIACVMIGLVQGIQSTSMWMELYLSIIGIVLFLAGWGIERLRARRKRAGKARDTVRVRDNKKVEF